MDWAHEYEQEQGFLREQLALVEEKIARLSNALGSCHDCLEADGLNAMLHGASLEHALLINLLNRNPDTQAGLLASQIIGQIDHYCHDAARLANGWRRGHPTPPDYWDAASQHAFLTRLLGVYNAWRAHRPYYPEARPSGNGTAPTRRDPIHAGSGGGGYMHPWYAAAPGGAGTSGKEDHESDVQTDTSRLRDALYAALHDARIPPDHITITVLAHGWVMATGIAHDDDQHARIIDVIRTAPGVAESLLDVQVVPEDRCPVCQQSGTPGG